MSKKDATERPKGPLPTSLRDLIESISMAILMAIGLKYFLFEAYSIPSPSMQPTLMGSVAAGAHDRILVDKAAYLFREPHRWDVAVFRYPHNRSQNYVKRIAGLSGETLSIRAGDLYKKNKDGVYEILRKPRTLQSAFWREIYDQASSEQPRAHFLPRGDWSWSPDNALVRKRPSGGESSILMRMQSELLDHYAHGYPKLIREAVLGDVPGHSGGQNVVGDLRIAATVTLQAGKVWIQETETEAGGRSRRFLLSVERAADGKGIAKLELYDSGKSVQKPSLEAELDLGALDSPATLRLELMHFDDRLTGTVDGQELPELVYETPAVPLEGNGGVSLRLGASGKGEARFRDFHVDRDLYYQASEAAGQDIEVPEGKCWMLGDNTHNSDDGRSWKTLTIHYDPATMKLLAPNHSAEGSATLSGNSRAGSGDADENPVLIPGKDLIVFTDLHGEEHVLHGSAEDFQRYGYGSNLASWPPKATDPIRFDRFVPKEYFLGRAFLTIWPANPFGLFRVGLIR